MAVAEQGCRKTRVPRRLGGQRPRRQGAHPPAGFSGTGHRLGTKPDQHEAHPRALGGQRQPAAYGQCVGRAVARKFEQHGGKTGAARALKPRLQHRHAIGGGHRENALGCETQLRQTRAMEKAQIMAGAPRPGPEQAAIGRACRHGKTQGCRAIARLGGINLVQRASGQRRKGGGRGSKGGQGVGASGQGRLPH